jgi:hypothetical protein
MDEWKNPRSDASFSFEDEEETRIIPMVETPATNPSRILRRSNRWRFVVKPIRRNATVLATMALR